MNANQDAVRSRSAAAGLDPFHCDEELGDLEMMIQARPGESGIEHSLHGRVGFQS
jgi:hypothetical protein